MKGSEEYAKPVGITAERGEKARSYISKQIDTLCQVIRMIGQLNEEGEIFTTFGELFQRLVEKIMRSQYLNLLNGLSFG